MSGKKIKKNCKSCGDIFHPKKIVCAACKYKDYLFLAPRHFDMVMHNQIKLMGVKSKEYKGHVEQGFIDQKGNFLNRKEAFRVAAEAGQIIEKTGGKDSKELYSEDLY